MLPRPPPGDYATNSSGQRERRDIEYANGDGDTAGNPCPPGSRDVAAAAVRQGRGGVDAHDGDGDEDGACEQGSLPGHRGQALACDEAGGEDPDVGGWGLEHGAGDLVDADIHPVDGGGEDSADEAADHLAVELGFGACAEEVACFEVLHHVAGLQGAGFGDGTGEEVGDEGGAAGEVRGGCCEREEELR